MNVIDPVAQGLRFQAAEVEISLRKKRFGELNDARLVGTNEALPVREENGLIKYQLRPDPVASILLGERQE